MCVSPSFLPVLVEREMDLLSYGDDSEEEIEEKIKKIEEKKVEEDKKEDISKRWEIEESDESEEEKEEKKRETQSDLPSVRELFEKEISFPEYLKAVEHKDFSILPPSLK